MNPNLLMLRLSSFLIVITTIILLVVIVPSRSLIQQINNPVPKELRPGNHIPVESSCNWSGYAGDGYVYCTIGDVSYSYLSANKVITYASVRLNSDVRIGDYLNSWGTPTGFATRYGGYQIIWGDVQVWTFGKSFSPYLPAYMLTMGEIEPSDQWSGLVAH